jgi:outer membrane protein OmpA-like peptidoglycan-associated protein
MPWYAVPIIILTLTISGCASEGGATGKRPVPKSETGALATPSGVATAASAASEPAVASSSGARTVAEAPHESTGSGAPPKRAGGPVASKKTRATSTVVVAVGGGLSNGAVSAYMESQKQDLQRALHDEIRSGSARVDKLPHNVVRVRMPARTAFETNSSSIKPGFCTTMDKVADVAVRYGKTMLTIVGHPDSGGSDEHKRKLSHRRALSVMQYLESKDVNPVRLLTLTKGESDTVGSNRGDADRPDNRRIEILVEPVVAK